MIKNVRFNTFIILLILNFNISASAFDEATYTNGMFGNSFFSINLGSGWTQNSNMLIGDIVTASFGRNNMADFVLINANYAQSTDPLFPISANSAEELMKDKRSVLESVGAYNSFSEDSFTTNGGYKVHVLRYTQNLSPSPQHYHFFIDATSSQYSGGQGNWFAIDVDFTSTTVQPVMTGISFEEAKAIIQSIDIDNGSPPHQLNGLSETPETLSQSLTTSEIFDSWFQSEWFGIFFDSNDGWIYHSKLSWLYATAQNEGIWIWADGKDWLWTSEDSFPHLYSDNTKDWIYLSISEQDLTKAYNFSNESWSDWSDLVLTKTNTPTTKNSSGEEAKAIEEIYYSDSMSEEEKIDAIGSIILFGL
jgi:hypothetical protein